MTPEPPVTVPFAIVLHGLCSPGLADDLRRAIQTVQKLREESAPFDDLADATTQVEAKKRKAAVARAESEFARATVVLAEDLSHRTRRGEFHLRGQQMQPGSPASSVVITLVPGLGISINPEVATISTADGAYTDVQGVLGPAPSVTAGEDAPRRLPLWDALLTWCDPRILCDIRRHEGCFSREELRAFDHPTLGAAAYGRGTLARSEYYRVRERLRHFWEDLERDLRRRIERGEVYLQGVLTRPELRQTHEAIPSTWATDLRFDFVAGTITVAGRRYVSVICSLDRMAADLLKPGSNESKAADVPAEDDAGVVPSVAEVRSMRRARGRQSYGMLIEAELRNNWEDVERRALKDQNGVPVWTELAKAMHKRIVKKARDDGHASFPSAETLRKSLPSIYQRVLEEKTGQ